jgi:replication-associated recombination protein RarA
MAKYVIHPQTARHVEQLAEHPSHAVLLVGPTGSGKDTLVRLIASRLLGQPGPESLDTYAYFKIIEPEKDKTSISIEAVRDLQQFTKLKLPKAADDSRQAGRLVYIRDADGLTTEAQNALLKLLEEPPADTVFILAAASQQQLLPTILSRVQTLTVQRPSRQAIETHFESAGHSKQAVGQAYFMSGGLPGLMHALLNDDEHPMKQAVATARQLLQQSQFERLTAVDKLSKDKTATLQLLFVLQHMARAAIEQSAARSSDSGAAADKAIRQWHKILRAAYEAEQAYAVSAQAKLTLTRLMLSL